MSGTDDSSDSLGVLALTRVHQRIRIVSKFAIITYYCVLLLRINLMRMLNFANQVKVHLQFLDVEFCFCRYCQQIF